MINIQKVSSTAIGWEPVSGDSITTSFSRQPSTSHSSSGEYPSGALNTTPHAYSTDTGQYIVSSAQENPNQTPFGYAGSVVEGLLQSSPHYHHHHHGHRFEGSPSGSGYSVSQAGSTYTANTTSPPWSNTAAMTMGGSFTGRQLPAPITTRTFSNAGSTSLPANQPYHSSPAWSYESSAYTTTGGHRPGCPAGQPFHPNTTSASSSQIYGGSGPSTSLGSPQARWNYPSQGSIGDDHTNFTQYQHQEPLYAPHNVSYDPACVGGHQPILMNNQRGSSTTSSSRDRSFTQSSRSRIGNHTNLSTTRSSAGYNGR